MRALLKKAEEYLEKALKYERLAELSQGYSCADIVHICNKAKDRAFRDLIYGKEREASMEDLVEILKATIPSIDKELLKRYERFRFTR